MSISITDSPWHPLVEQRVKAAFYYQPAWLTLITKLYGYTLQFLTTSDTNGQITGFLPLCSLPGMLRGRRLVGLPFSDFCPLITLDDTSTSDLVEQAIELAQKQKARYLELRSGTNSVLAQHPNLSTSNLYVHWQRPLANDPEAIWSDLRKPVQRQIKKARNLGVQVRIAQERGDVEQYYRLHLKTRTRLGMPAQPRQFFFGLWDAFADRDMMKVLLAEYQGATIAGMVLLAAGSTVRYAYGASDEHHLNLAPNNLLMWTAITWGCTHGHQTLDLGRTACDNQGLMEFKRRWGATQEALPYYYYPRVQGLAATSESSKTYHFLTTCWRRLPLQIAGPLGGYLYRNLG
ncbi:MAG TPA: GNAT family N-acetyltransferase [Ktedonobacteraceae bacterium]|nr:GNAT family N-acetyltransferase [Ktedonobacteraceae bacterium]